VLVRGSVGTGYKAPSVFQVKAQRQKFGVSGGSVDCTSPDAAGVTLAQVASSLGAQCLDGQLDVIAAGNADLKPERSTQATLGVRLEPTAQFSFGADWWTVGIRDAIGQIDQNAILGDYTRYASSFTTSVSSATGQTLLALYQPNVNQGKEWRTGIDFDVTGRTRVAAGVQLNSQLNATWMLRDSYQLIEDGPYASSLGRVGDNGAVTFRWQARWVNTLAIGAWQHTLVLNYKSGYHDYDVAAAGLANINIVNADGSIGDAVDTLKRSVSDYLSVDWQSHWQLPRGIDLNIGVLNVFDTDPPRSIAVGGANQGFQVGYDDRYYDPRGRTVYVNLIYRF
jgi:iron complex outermembrane receptor protein